MVEKSVLEKDEGYMMHLLLHFGPSAKYAPNTPCRSIGTVSILSSQQATCGGRAYCPKLLIIDIMDCDISFIGMLAYIL